MRIGVLLLSLSISTAATAQDRGAAVGGSVSAVNMDSRTDTAFSGSFAFRFSRVVEFEVDTTWVPRVRSEFPDGPVVIQTATSTFFSSGSLSPDSAQIFPTPFYSNPGGRIAIFTNAARIDIPTSTTRLTPYFAAGGGVANVRRTADFTYPIFSPLATPTTFPPPVRQTTQRITSSTTNLALTLGGGVDVKVASALSVDADLRLFRLLGDDDRNLGRFGVGLRYRF